MDTAPDSTEFQFGTFSRRVVWACLVFGLLLVVLDLVFNVLDITGDRSVRRIFNIAREQSLPTWFASMQAVMVGVVAMFAAWLSRSRRTRWGWIAVGLFFIYVGADDAAEIHERVGSAIGRAAEKSGSTWKETFPTFAWQLFVAPLLAAGLLSSVVFSWLQSKDSAARRWILVAVVCFGVSQGLDFLEGIESLESSYKDLAERWNVRVYVITHSFKVLEEWLEMVGTAGFLAAFLNIAGGLAAGRCVRFVA